MFNCNFKFKTTITILIFIVTTVVTTVVTTIVSMEKAYSQRGKSAASSSTVGPAPAAAAASAANASGFAGKAACSGEAYPSDYDWETSERHKTSNRENVDANDVYLRTNWSEGKKAWDQHMDNVKKAKVNGEKEGESYNAPNF
ncbi:MAG: hypothetical protein HQK49_06190 [Oligoflexia bacterium]|nr:hypothetical protein [Oligoflexia bacterium]